MTEAEIMELINVKRQTLEQARSNNSDAASVQTLEAEIKELESSLAKAAAPKRQRKVFLDECAG